jgi:hypothetical protein
LTGGWSASNARRLEAGYSAVNAPCHCNTTTYEGTPLPFPPYKGGRQQEVTAKKLRAQEIADAIIGALKVDDRGFIPEFSVFATNAF